MTVPARRGRPKKADGGATRQSIIAAAFGLIARQGPAGLTFRALAAACDVTPMSIAYHVGNRRELMRLLAEQAFCDIAFPPDGPPLAQLRALLGAYAEKTLVYPGLVRMILADPALMPASLDAVTDRMRQLIAAAGHAADTETLISLLVDFVHGYALAAAVAPPGHTLTHQGLMTPVDWVLARLAAPGPVRTQRH